MTLCDGADLKVCDRCRHYSERKENEAQAMATAVRMRPMVRNGGCMDWVALPANGGDSDKQDRL